MLKREILVALWILASVLFFWPGLFAADQATVEYHFARPSPRSSFLPTDFKLLYQSPNRLTRSDTRYGLRNYQPWLEVPLSSAEETGKAAGTLGLIDGGQIQLGSYSDYPLCFQLGGVELAIHFNDSFRHCFDFTARSQGSEIVFFSSFSFDEKSGNYESVEYRIFRKTPNASGLPPLFYKRIPESDDFTEDTYWAELGRRETESGSFERGLDRQGASYHGWLFYAGLSFSDATKPQTEALWSLKKWAWMYASSQLSELWPVLPDSDYLIEKKVRLPDGSERYFRGRIQVGSGVTADFSRIDWTPLESFVWNDVESHGFDSDWVGYKRADYLLRYFYDN